MKKAVFKIMKGISFVVALVALVSCVALIYQDGFTANPKSYLGALSIAIGFGGYGLFAKDSSS